MYPKNEKDNLTPLQQVLREPWKVQMKDGCCDLVASVREGGDPARREKPSTFVIKTPNVKRYKNCLHKLNSLH